MPQTQPFGGNANLAGPSPDTFALLTTYNESSLATPVTAPLLPKEVRFIKCIATGGTLTLQSRGAAAHAAANDGIVGVFSVIFAVGDVFDLSYIVAVTGIPNNNSFIGGV